jgi:cytochrome c553
MRRWLIAGAAVLAALAVGGFLVAMTGIVPIKASAGHWAITEWVLELGKRRSVSTHTLGDDEPALDEPWLVLKGAGHYEIGCRPCHGAPDLPRLPSVARAMMPPPPALPARIQTWAPDELFYIVKHGIKLTGMPAWPSQHRDDEVRAMVAFLLELPNLDAAGYRRLVHGDAPPSARTPLEDLVGETTPPAVIASCARCHGVDGRGRGNAAFPTLAGQRAEYQFDALRAYADGRRHSGTMQAIAAALSPDEMRVVSRYYASLPAPVRDPASAAVSAAVIERGRQIALRGVPEHRVPSCVHCHGPGPTPRNPAYPVLAGQYADYLVLQLQQFERGRRGGAAYAHLMDHVAPHLEPGEMRAVAEYYSSLEAAR